MTLSEELKKLNACNDAIYWTEGKTYKQAWEECDDAEWLMWYLAHKLSKNRIIFLAAKCAESVLHIYEAKHPNDKRVRACIQACFDYSEDKITLGKLRKYCADAYDAASATSAVAAVDADADAAVDADVNANANAACYAVYIAATAAYSTDATVAIYAADATANVAVCKQKHIELCDMIKSHVKFDKLMETK